MDKSGLPDRRDILSGLATAAAVAGIPSAVLAASATPVIEWETHMFSNDTAKFPYKPGATDIPAASRQLADPLATYQAHLKEFGIDRAVIVQPEPYGDDHKLVLDCMDRTSPQQFKFTSLFFPADSAAPQKMEALVKAHPRICSTRLHVHRKHAPYFASFAEPGVRALWGKAVDLGLVIELDMGSDYARDASAAIIAFPGCKVLLDHLAGPASGTAWNYADVLDMAQLPNVYMKLSALSFMSKDGPNYESLLPFTRRIIKEYGPDRMVWSGDSPKLVDVHMAGYSEADKAKVRGGNLQKLLNWA